MEDTFELNYHVNFYDGTSIKELVNSDFNKNKTGLKDKNLTQKNGLIIFYSNLCSSCQKGYVNFINLSDMFKNRFKIFAVNCNNIKMKNDYLIRDFKINKYPQYKLIINNKIKDINIDGYKIEDIIYVIENNL